MNDSRIRLGQKIKYYREMVKMSQEELAIKAGYKSKSSIAKIENGLARVPAYKLIEISTVLGVSVTEFLETPMTAEEPRITITTEINSKDRLRNVLSIILALDETQLEKAESILSTVFEVKDGNTNLQ